MKKSRKIIYGVGISLCLLTSINTCFAATGKVNVEAVRIRAEANTESAVLDVAYENDNVEIIGETGDWYKVNFNGNTGYASKEYITNEDDQTSSDETDSNVSNTNTTSDETNTTNTVENETQDNTSSATNNEANTEVEGSNEISSEDLTDKTVRIKTNTQLKLLPTFSSNSIASLETGNEVKVIFDLQNWIKVESNSNQGWIAKTLVEDAQQTTDNTETTTNEETSAEEETTTSNVNKTGYVNVETANVREAADISSKLVNTLDEFDEVTIKSESGDWYEIEAGDVNGYVSKSLITIGTISSRGLVRERKVETNSSSEEIANVEEAVNSEPVANVNKGQEVADFAKQFLGLQYVLGGKTPETGFDCSGFTKYVFKNFGFNLVSVSADQTSIGKEVSKDELKVGDLILFYDEAKTKIGHVGIYLGNDEFIHAANATRGVVIDGLSSNSYYNTRFVTARRIVE